MATQKKKLNLKSHHHFFLGAIIAILLLLLLWLAAVHYHWGPYKRRVTIPTAPEVSAPANSDSSQSSGGSSSGANGSNGSTGASGSNGSNGSNGGSTPAPATGTSIFNLYGSVSNGQTKQEVESSSNGLNPNCLKTSSNPGGKQEVCTYSEGDRVVTVTYLNDRVIGVSKGGF